MTDSELRSRIRQALDQSMPPLPDDPALTEAVLERHEERRQKRRARMSGLRVAVAMAVMTLFVFGGVIMQGWSHLITYQSRDGEQYVMRGVSVTPPVGQSADAAIDLQETVVFYTEHWDEVIKILEKIPLTPVWLPDKWEVAGYDVIVNNMQEYLTIYYEKPVPGKDEPDVMVYHVINFSDLQYFYMAIEANNEGRYVDLENGLSVYMDKNIDRSTSMWQEGLTGYGLSGDITEEELLHIIRAMYGLD